MLLYFRKKFLDGRSHEITLATHTVGLRQKQLSICTHTVVITILQGWAGRAGLQYSGKIETKIQTASTFPESQSFIDCSMERSIRYNFWIDLGSIQHKLSFDYS